MAAGWRLASGAGATRLSLRLGLLLASVALLGPDVAGGAASEPGRWHLEIGGQGEHLLVFPKTMFNRTAVMLKFLNETCDSDVMLTITCYLRSSRCHDEVYINEKKAVSYLNRYEYTDSIAGGGQYVYESKQIYCHSLNELHTWELPLPKKLEPPQELRVPSSGPPGKTKREAPESSKDQNASPDKDLELVPKPSAEQKEGVAQAKAAGPAEEAKADGKKQDAPGTGGKKVGGRDGGRKMFSGGRKDPRVPCKGPCFFLGKIFQQQLPP
ncbi:uncharacterized protein LOC132585908 [Heteronotia binoei]|uniref:uncharacterized protein LOC132585908 n=1 Tax=Heteronotia binoei TaxID=13085 RepID=UPI0029308190|nr:uncharacterized protein LOC132585908 [Heteronotia binoei]